MARCQVRCCVVRLKEIGFERAGPQLFIQRAPRVLCERGLAAHIRVELRRVFFVYLLRNAIHRRLRIDEILEIKCFESSSQSRLARRPLRFIMGTINTQKCLLLARFLTTVSVSPSPEKMTDAKDRCNKSYIDMNDLELHTHAHTHVYTLAYKETHFFSLTVDIIAGSFSSI